jgi:hypothetical protein
MVGIGIADPSALARADALSGAISFLTSRISAVELLELGVINIGAERFLHGNDVSAVPIAG